VQGCDLFPLLLTPGAAQPLRSGQSCPAAEGTSEGPNVTLVFAPWARLFPHKRFADPAKDNCFLPLTS